MLLVLRAHLPLTLSYCVNVIFIVFYLHLEYKYYIFIKVLFLMAAL